MADELATRVVRCHIALDAWHKYKAEEPFLMFNLLLKVRSDDSSLTTSNLLQKKHKPIGRSLKKKYICKQKPTQRSMKHTATGHPLNHQRLSQLSDDEILQGFKDANARIVKEYYYGYCRIAYCVYDKRYALRSKPGMDFYSLAHEYFIYLATHHFKPLEDRKSSMSLKTWMINGFRFLLLDKLKGVAKENRLESFESMPGGQAFDATDSQFEQELYHTIEDICDGYYGRDSKESIILKMLYIEGFKGKDVASQLGVSASAVTQRCQKMMHDVVIPYFKRYFVASDYMSYRTSYDIEGGLQVKVRMCCSIMPMSDKMPSKRSLRDTGENFHLPYMNEMDNIQNGRITPRWIENLKENEVFVFGSNLAGMHGGGAARVARLRFGAVMGQGVGMQGQSYAIPTMQGGVDTIRPYVDEFIAYAKQHPDHQFLVTPIGCGIAGFEAEDIAPLFAEAINVKNISLPQSFWDVIA